MARYDQAHKAATRERILQTSGQRFKGDGIAASGVATLMADAGLTNGAFYAHFDSKDDLVARVVEHELAAQAAAFEELPAGIAGIERFVVDYLSPTHRDDAGSGCPSASLLAEIARSGESVLVAYTESLLRMIDDLGTRVSPDAPSATRIQLLSILALLAGALQLSRAIADPEVSDALLDAARSRALELLRMGTAPASA